MTRKVQRYDPVLLIIFSLCYITFYFSVLLRLCFLYFFYCFAFSFGVFIGKRKRKVLPLLINKPYFLPAILILFSNFCNSVGVVVTRTMSSAYLMLFTFLLPILIPPLQVLKCLAHREGGAKIKRQ